MPSKDCNFYFLNYRKTIMFSKQEYVHMNYHNCMISLLLK